MKATSNFITTLCAVLLLSACNQKSTFEIKAPEGWSTYQTKEYAIFYPSDWQLDTSGMYGSRLFVLHEDESDSNGFGENINLLVRELGKDAKDLDYYVTESEKQITQMFVDGNLEKSERKNANGNEYHTVIFSANQGGRIMKFRQCYWIKNNKAYILTFTTLINDFDTYISTANQMMDGFVLK